MHIGSACIVIMYSVIYNKLSYARDLLQYSNLTEYTSLSFDQPTGNIAYGGVYMKTKNTVTSLKCLMHPENRNRFWNAICRRVKPFKEKPTSMRPSQWNNFCFIPCWVTLSLEVYLLTSSFFIGASNFIHCMVIPSWAKFMQKYFKRF